MNASLIL